MHNYQINLKKKTKQTSRTEQNQRYEDHLKGYQLGGGRRRMGGKLQGLRSRNWEEFQPRWRHK